MNNLHTRAKDAAPDGDGPRPLEALSRGLVSREQCNRYIHYGVLPGKTLLATVMRKSGSSVSRLANTRVRVGACAPRWQLVCFSLLIYVFKCASA